MAKRLEGRNTFNNDDGNAYFLHPSISQRCQLLEVNILKTQNWMDQVAKFLGGQKEGSCCFKMSLEIVQISKSRGQKTLRVTREKVNVSYILLSNVFLTINSW